MACLLVFAFDFCSIELKRENRTSSFCVQEVMSSQVWVSSQKLNSFLSGPLDDAWKVWWKSMNVYDVLSVLCLILPPLLASFYILFFGKNKKGRHIGTGSEGLYAVRARSASDTSDGGTIRTPTHFLQYDLDSFGADIFIQSPDDPNFYSPKLSRLPEGAASKGARGGPPPAPAVSTAANSANNGEELVMYQNGPSRISNTNNALATYPRGGTGSNQHSPSAAAGGGRDSNLNVATRSLREHVAKNHIVQSHHQYSSPGAQTTISDLTASPDVFPPSLAFPPIADSPPNRPEQTQQPQQPQESQLQLQLQPYSRPQSQQQPHSHDQQLQRPSSEQGVVLYNGGRPDQNGEYGYGGTLVAQGERSIALVSQGPQGMVSNASKLSSSASASLGRAVQEKLAFKQFVNNFYRTLGGNGIRVQLLRHGKLIYRFLKLDRDKECLFWNTGESWFNRMRGKRREWPVKNIKSVTKGMRIYVESFQGRSFTLEVEPSELVHDIKLKIAACDNIELYQIDVLYNGKVLAYDKSLVSYGIENGASIVYGQRGNSNSSTMLQNVDKMVRNQLVKTGPFGFELVLKDSKSSRLKAYLMYVERESERDFFVKNFQYMMDHLELASTVMRSLNPVTSRNHMADNSPGMMMPDDISTSGDTDYGPVQDDLSHIRPEDTNDMDNESIATYNTSASSSLLHGEPHIQGMGFHSSHSNTAANTAANGGVPLAVSRGGGPIGVAKKKSLSSSTFGYMMRGMGLRK